MSNDASERVSKEASASTELERLKRALDEQQSRLFEAIAVLELSAEFISANTPMDIHQQARMLCSTEAALRLLQAMQLESDELSAVTKETSDA